MTITASLAARELRVRWGRAVLAASVVAAAVALSASLELLGRERERAVEAQLDAAGPALRVVPPGIGAADVALLRGGAAPLTVRAPAVREVLGRRARRVEERAVLRDSQAGLTVVGVPASSPSAPGGPRRARIGSGLAERMRLEPGATFRVLGREMVVDGVAPSNADASDFAVLVRSPDVGDPDPTQIDVYLEPRVDARDAEMELLRAMPHVGVVRSARGELVEGGLQQAIARHRWAVQLVAALVAAVASIIATHLDVSERRRELALLVAVGMGARQVAALVVHRAAMCSLAGAVAGVVVAAAAVQAASSADPAALALVGGVAVLLSTALAAIAAAPVALITAAADPVLELQQG